ncbi:Signal recognition particle core component, partial [Ascosphaera pollenicola]
PEKIGADARYLTKIPELISDIDVAALEEEGVATIPKEPQPTKRPAAALADNKAEQPLEQPKKKRCLRKSRIPKDFDPNKQPDPERWLPLRDRLSYRPPKGKKAKQRAAERTQGGVVVEESAPAAQPSQVATQSKSGGASGSKKKKGKGRR